VKGDPKPDARRHRRAGFHAVRRGATANCTPFDTTYKSVLTH
jgi:hypothetical protein